jgi:hypothetical protein
MEQLHDLQLRGIEDCPPEREGEDAREHMGSSSVLRRDLEGYSGDDDDHFLFLQLHNNDLLSDDVHHHDKGQAERVQPDGRVVGVQRREELVQGNQHIWQR